MPGRPPRFMDVPTSAAAPLVLIALVTAWSLPIAIRMIDAGDYPDHLKSAAAVAAAPHLPAPHFLYFVSVAALMRIAPEISVRAAGVAVTTAFVVATAVVMWWYLRRTNARVPDVAIVPLTVALLVVGPVLPPMASPDVFLIGFFVPNPYHNATIVAARPFAVALVICAAAALGRSAMNVGPWFAAAVVCLSAVSKPNFLLCLVPALALAATVSVVRRRAIRWVVLLAIVIPAALLAAILREAYGGKGVEVIFAPFAAMRFHTAIDATLALKLLASVAFPVAVTILWPRSIVTHGEFGLAWLAMIVAVLQAYLLAEAGPRIDHANLMAGASLAVFVLMVTSSSAVLASRSRGDALDAIRLAAAAVVFACHLWGGFRHVLVTMMTPQRWSGPLMYVALAVGAIWLAAAIWQARGSVVSPERKRLHTK